MFKVAFAGGTPLRRSPSGKVPTMDGLSPRWLFQSKLTRLKAMAGALKSGV
ncbi:MAG: hypothetical protein LBF41_02020 [Deltaproteobacteria bacterium]|jgi:hypothetical protein|nr:hypothetical protein [Deltaproteobacteria bacterium]